MRSAMTTTPRLNFPDFSEEGKCRARRSSLSGASTNSAALILCVASRTSRLPCHPPQSWNDQFALFARCFAQVEAAKVAKESKGCNRMCREKCVVQKRVDDPLLA